jgi:hypothetical protein
LELIRFTLRDPFDLGKQGMARLERTIKIDGQILMVPQYLNRTVSGWQVRVRDQPSQHFADAYFGGAAQALTAAAGAVNALLAQRAASESRNAVPREEERIA